jgi:transcriptional regulator with XRE-family HTH domain
MGRGARRRPQYLAAKLREIRHGLGLSQAAIVKHLGLTDYIRPAEISDFENGVREPDLLTLMAYAKRAGISIDYLVDDDAELPGELPGVGQARGLSGKPQKLAAQKQAKASVNTTITLRLLIKSDEGSSQEESRARRTIERVHLKQYGMKKLKEDEYELIVPYQNDERLAERIYTLFGAIIVEVNRRKCSAKVTIREKGTGRYW